MSEYQVHQIRVARARGVRRTALKTARPVQKLRRKAAWLEMEFFFERLRCESLQENYEALHAVTAALMQQPQ